MNAQNQEFIIKTEDGTYVLYRDGYRRVFKKVVEMRRLEISAKCYNVIRSFVESSRKEEYTWNIGIIVANKIQFIKMHKWVLVVDPDGIKLLRYKDYTTGADSATAAVLYISRNNTDVINICGHQVPIDAISQLSTVITSDVPAARGIYLYELVRKISEYIDF
ncbi:hypothetical protein [Thermofilum sp.]|uniref:hypothetical protein n=1 Tax=Thermofilum sp. TaxID=1961369 RepID=UPI00317BA338